MEMLTERYADRLAGVLSCYDRIVITGTLPGVCYAQGMTSFLYAKGIRIFDYNRNNIQMEPVPITPEIYDKFGDTLRTVLLAAIPGAVFFMFFLWKFTAAVIYSGFALIINRFRPQMVRRGDMLDVDDVNEHLAIELLGIVPEDESVIVSTNRGEPAVLNVNSRAGEAYRNISRP